MLMHQQANSPMMAPHPHGPPPPPGPSPAQYGGPETSPMNPGVSNFSGMEGFNYQVNATSPSQSTAMINNGNALSPFSPDMSSSSMGIPSPTNNSMPYSPHQPHSSINSPCGPDTPPPAYSPMDEPKYASQLQMAPPHNDNAMDTSNFVTAHGAGSSVVLNEPQYWCNIAYYELNSRVGEIFHAKSNCNDVYVDGFTDPGCSTNSRDKFCLGQLSNVNRNSTIENTRRHIGQGTRLLNSHYDIVTKQPFFYFPGIRLRYSDGRVYVKCLSKHAIFVQSRNCNAIYHNPPTTVCKVPSESELVIFDESSFADFLRESAKKDYQSVFELSKMCTIR